MEHADIRLAIARDIRQAPTGCGSLVNCSAAAPGSIAWMVLAQLWRHRQVTPARIGTYATNMPSTGRIYAVGSLICMRSERGRMSVQWASM